jgi:hypothetical protein
MNTTRSPCRPGAAASGPRCSGPGSSDAAAHRPEIDDVADQEEVLGRVFAQEIQEAIGLAGPRAEVDVGHENGSDLGHALNKFTLTGRHIGFGEDRLGGAFRYAKRAIDTLFRVNRQKVVALVETIDGTDHHAVRVFALDAVLGNDKAHFRALLVGQRF